MLSGQHFCRCDALRMCFIFSAVLRVCFMLINERCVFGPWSKLPLICNRLVLFRSGWVSILVYFKDSGCSLCSCFLREIPQSRIFFSAQEAEWFVFLSWESFFRFSHYFRCMTRVQVSETMRQEGFIRSLSVFLNPHVMFRMFGWSHVWESVPIWCLVYVGLLSSRWGIYQPFFFALWGFMSLSEVFFHSHFKVWECWLHCAPYGW